MTPRRRIKRAAVAGALSAMALIALSAAAGAQAPPHGAGVGEAPPESGATARVLDLTPAQRLAIYQSITETGKNNVAPIGFRATVGARVPETVQLKPLSDTLAKLIPQARDFSIGMIEKQVILVDPNTRQVVAVVTQEPASAEH
jgi:Protein of unknown function (DUF1236)